MNQDFRLAARTFRQSPAFTLIAVLSLALGIGASTSVYSLTFTLFFAPPAGVAHPESLVRICRLVDGRPEGHELSYADFLYYREHATAFTELASDGNVRLLTDTERAEQLLAAVVSPSYFTVLGLRPGGGRFFLPGEDTAAGREPVVVLSHDFWQRRFVGDTRSIGGRLILGGVSYTIVGVAPPSFEGSSAGSGPRFPRCEPFKACGRAFERRSRRAVSVAPASAAHRSGGRCTSQYPASSGSSRRASSTPLRIRRRSLPCAAE